MTSTTPKSSMSQARPEAYRPSMDDDEAPLIHPQNEHSEGIPYFSTGGPMVNIIIQLVRVLTLPICMVDCNLVRYTQLHRALPGLFIAFFSVFMAWNISHPLGSLFRFSSRERHAECHIGAFMCSYRRPGNGYIFVSPKTWSFTVKAVDFIFCMLMMGVTIGAFEKGYIWRGGIRSGLQGLTTTLTVLQFIIFVLGLFSHLPSPKIRICVYVVKDDEEHIYRFPQWYRDTPKRAASFASLAVEDRGHVPQTPSTTSTLYL